MTRGWKQALAVAGIAIGTAAAAAQDAKSTVPAAVDEYRQQAERTALQIWDFAEVGYQETKSSALLQQQLRDAGFTVQAGVAGMPTGFVASYGSGKPVIGILAEFDALPGITGGGGVGGGAWGGREGGESGGGGGARGEGGGGGGGGGAGRWGRGVVGGRRGRGQRARLKGGSGGGVRGGGGAGGGRRGGGGGGEERGEWWGGGEGRGVEGGGGGEGGIFRGFRPAPGPVEGVGNPSRGPGWGRGGGGGRELSRGLSGYDEEPRAGGRDARRGGG